MISPLTMLTAALAAVSASPTEVLTEPAAVTTTYSVGGETINAGTDVVTSVLAETTSSGGGTITLSSTKTGMLGTMESLASHVVHGDGVPLQPVDFSGVRFVAGWSTVVVGVVVGAFAGRLF